MQAPAVAAPVVAIAVPPIVSVDHSYKIKLGITARQLAKVKVQRELVQNNSDLALNVSENAFLPSSLNSARHVDRKADSKAVFKSGNFVWQRNVAGSKLSLVNRGLVSYVESRASRFNDYLHDGMALSADWMSVPSP